MSYAVIDEGRCCVLSVHVTIQSALAATQIASEGEVHAIEGLNHRYCEPLRIFLRSSFPRDEKPFREDRSERGHVTVLP